MILKVSFQTCTIIWVNVRNISRDMVTAGSKDSESTYRVHLGIESRLHGRIPCRRSGVWGCESRSDDNPTIRRMLSQT